ncbi:hypothetical protein [Leisingera sp. ANG-S5]|uniref:hypothetical protein n=1 Tax=Leisingera sp. ANG-S5 TaxID=1577901 RepID=UPI00057D6EDA|nr:hypothetical protein [Leisingera sp. ANG-S5]KIC31515.1 hypothetical protein RA25_15445 [Leisingera sp. ANG-S5]
MASYSGLLRKAPAGRLQAFLATRQVHAPDDFDWNSEGRGTKFVREIEDLLGGLPDRQQDAVKAELDHLHTLADANGLTAAERICAGQGIDLEGLEGVQDVLLMLAVSHPQIIDRVSADTSLMRRTGGKGWAAFQFDDDGKPWALDDAEARNAFLRDVLNILDVAEHRRSEADWFRSIRVHPITREESEITQATIYVEDRAASELAFGSSETLERHLVQKVLEVGLACDPQSRIVEIAARGTKKVRDQYAASFAKHFAPNSAAPVEAPRRDVQLEILRTPVEFVTEPADGITRIEVSSLDFFSVGGAFARFEKRGEDETIYQFLERRFGAMSPLRTGGWTIFAATLRISLEARDGKRPRTLTVTLRTPNTTTLPNKTEADRHFVFALLERWGLLTQPQKDFDLFEDVS